MTIDNAMLSSTTPKPMMRGYLGVVVDAERRDAGQQQQAEQQPDDADLDRVAAFRRPVDVAQVNGERELVEDERRADPEPDREQVDADVARLERELIIPQRSVSTLPATM